MRALCDKYGIVLIFDEVMAGFGRTGEWFAWQGFGGRAGVIPDLITFAKGVNSGYVPAGGVVISESIANAFEDQVFPGGLTYSGHPLAMASIVASIDAMESEGIVANAKTIGEKTLGPALEELAANHPIIGEARGLGVFWALDLVDDQESRMPVSAGLIAELKKALMKRHLRAVHGRQPPPRRAAVRHHPRRRGPRHRDHRRGPHRDRGQSLDFLLRLEQLPKRR